ncbi:MAG TPA: hypothetical protein VG672_04845, partial [Bryobacteraceae bacterium]|nr:hypothetical protein [Bryobacteraceae bacterium]
MRSVWGLLGLVAGLLVANGPSLAAPKKAAAAGPNAISVFPISGQRGSTFAVTVRGSQLRETRSVFTEDPALTFTVEGCEAEPPDPAAGGAKPKTPFDLVRLRVQVAADAAPGRHLFRVVTGRGISNALPLYVSELPVTAEPAGAHESPATAVAVEKLPAVISGRIGQRGETDYYVFPAKAGETITFEAISGLPSLAGPGGNAAGFDPALSIYEDAPSWLDDHHVKRIAFNDEPLWVAGRLTNAYLTHRFEKDGRYLLRVEAFSGQGGPDYGYRLRMVSGPSPATPDPPDDLWEERVYSRRLSANRL